MITENNKVMLGQALLFGLFAGLGFAVAQFLFALLLQVVVRVALGNG